MPKIQQLNVARYYIHSYYLILLDKKKSYIYFFAHMFEQLIKISVISLFVLSSFGSQITALFLQLTDNSQTVVYNEVLLLVHCFWLHTYSAILC